MDGGWQFFFHLGLLYFKRFDLPTIKMWLVGFDGFSCGRIDIIEHKSSFLSGHTHTNLVGTL